MLRSRRLFLLARSSLDHLAITILVGATHASIGAGLSATTLGCKLRDTDLGGRSE